MSMGTDTGTDTMDWYVEADPVLAGTGARDRHLARAWREEQRANSRGLIITTSLFFVLVASAVMLGGHAAIGPLLSEVVAARDANATGQMLYSMPDGVFCRHMSFDNRTEAMTEGAIERCPAPIGGHGGGVSTDFRWSTR
jgi:hypothetical protein